jgi:transposase
MSMGKWSEESVQGEMFLTSADFPSSPGHVFYDHLNTLLADSKFDPFVESLCRPYYEDRSKGGRPSLPPGVYFRMLFVGYFEGIDSQRGIAWRVSDSLSLRTFLGLSWREKSPDHSSLTKIRKRLPVSVHTAVFEWVLKLCRDNKLLNCPSVVGVDSTTIEANAAMRTIVRKDTDQDYFDYVKTLMKEGEAPSSDTLPNKPSPTHLTNSSESTTNEASTSSPTSSSTSSSTSSPSPEPTLEEILRFDRKRKGKTCSNDDWKSSIDPDSRIARMKDGTTHLAYKVEHVVDLDSEVILAAVVDFANEADARTMTHSVMTARCHLKQAGLTELTINAGVADKGYHSKEQLALNDHFSILSYVAEPDRPRYNWSSDHDGSQQKAVYANRRRGRSKLGKALQRRRSEVTERSFAHVCETGGSRRSWLRTLTKVRKRYSMAVAARNLGLLMRKMFGIGKPRTLQTGDCGNDDGGNGGCGGKGGGISLDKVLKQLLHQLQCFKNHFPTNTRRERCNSRFAKNRFRKKRNR